MVFHPPNKLFAAAYRKFLHLFIGKAVLLLTTTGRKTGNPHTIGLQYELINGNFHIGAADGEKADWYRNLKKNPIVKVQAGKKSFTARAMVIEDIARITEFLEYRLRKHPLMIRMILRLSGVTGTLTREILEKYALGIGMVILIPLES